MLRISAVEEAARDAILTLDASEYDQGAITAEWSEMRSFALQDEAASVVHLRFHAAVQSSTVTDQTRGRGYTDEQVESLLVVSFAYHLRPGHHAVDLRKSHDAAQDVVSVVNRLCQDRMSTLFSRISTVVDTDRGLAIKAVEFRIIHSIEV